MTKFCRIAPVAFLLSVIANGAALAQANEEAAVNSTIACLEIAHDAARLACLDEAASTLKATRIIREEEEIAKAEEERERFGLSGKPDAPEKPVVAVTETPEDFGAEALEDVRKERDAKRLKRIEAKVAEVRINKLGKVTLTLDNGQVWRQLSSDNKSIRFPRRENLYTAKIKRGGMGNYMLTVKELRRTIRVKRIK